MGKWLKRIRGAVGMGLTWALGWAPVGAVVGLITGLAVGFPLAGVAFNYAILFGFLGFFGGTIFSTVLGLAEGDRSFDQLRLGRFVAWGALGGLLLGGAAVAAGILGPGLSIVDVIITGLSTLLGAGSAAGTLAIARASSDGPLLPSDRGPATPDPIGEGAESLHGG